MFTWAVPLPPSFERPLEDAVVYLPKISVVVQQVPDSETGATVNYVPVDPCQPVIMGIRVAIGEGIYRAYIDRETAGVEPIPFVSPDAYVLKRLPYAAFAAAMVPTLTAPPEGSQQESRIAWMAFQLHQLELEYEHILCLCHFADWPWIRQAYQQRADYHEPDTSVRRPEQYLVDPASLYFVLGELPFLTELLTTGERAIVSVINSGKLHQPIVTITHDPSGQPYIVPLVIDLANQDAEAPPRGIGSVLGTIPTEFERSCH